MSNRAITVLAALTLLVTLAATWLWTINERTPSAGLAREEIMFPALSADNVGLKKLEVATGSYELALILDGDTWRLAGPGGYLVAQESVDRLLAEVAGLRRWAPRTSQPDLYDRLGVGPVVAGAGSRLVRLWTAAETPVVEIIAGSRSASIGIRPAGGIFVREPDAPQAWLAEGSVTIPAAIGAWLGTVFHVSGPEVQRISVMKGEQAQAVAVKHQGSTTYTLEFIDPALAPGGGSAKDDGFKSLTRGIVTLTALDVRPAAEVHFDEAARRVVFETTAGLRLAAHVGHADGAEWLRFTAEAMQHLAAEQAAEITARTDGWAFLLDASRTAAFTTPMGDLVELAGLVPAPVMVQP